MIMTHLKMGNLYSVYESGMDVWLEDYKYLGTSSLDSKIHLFVSTDYPFVSQNDVMEIPEEDIETTIK